MLQGKGMYFLGMIADVLTQKKKVLSWNQYKMNSRHNPSLIGSEYVGLNNLHKIGITSEHLLKLSSSVAIKILHFVVILKMKIP